MDSNKYSARIESLRQLMRDNGWDAVILTGSDPHSSEYPAERWQQVKWLTGFTGEAGDVVVTMDHAGLWTDTRYFIQAVQQLEGSGAVLHKTRVTGQVLIPEWLDLHFKGKDDVRIAVDGLCQNVSAIDELEKNFTVVDVPDLLSCLWTERPEIPQTPIFAIDPGESRLQKIEWLRSFLEEKSCDCILLTSLDEIAWMLNVRASDIEYNPLVISYLLVSREDVKWFVQKGQIEDSETEAAFSELRSDGVYILPYNDISLYFNDIEGRLYIDESTLNYHLYSLLGCDTLAGTSPVVFRKSIKNPTEIKGMKEAHILDGTAMEKFLFWLEKSLDADKVITEWDAAVKLGQLRSELSGYQGDSFETISAYGKGAALPHYITPHDNAPVLRQEGLYLCDSGGQFTSGTTDITRTIPLGECSELEKEDYTLVLKGHIDLAMAIFPEGTAGCQIDALARNPLWKAKRNFGHGTGHGVGYFLGVHEGPQDIRQNFNRQSLTPGMITSDEPGIYREGLHGVRHENLLLCVDKGQSEFGHWYGFENLTLCHFDTSAILWELLDQDEIDWLNDYNRHVYNTLAPMLPPEVAEWLKAKTLLSNRK
ncbi:MAG: aminopeptidase P family protein [Bacteroidales bacterium]|nr:aminopeptidase P family protein [Bacteroidales bacterium]